MSIECWRICDWPSDNEKLNQKVFILSTANEIRSLDVELKGLDRTKEETDVLLHALSPTGS